MDNTTIQQYNKAFTLIELVVVIAIISMITALTLPNFRAGGNQYSLQRSANKLAQDIRKAQQMAMSAEETGGSVPPGYGIYLQQGDGNYLLYADNNPPSGNNQYSGGDTVIETIYLEGKVYIKEVSPSSASINFSPPNPTVSISGGSDISIILSLEGDSSKTKTVKVNSAGMINVE